LVAPIFSRLFSIPCAQKEQTIPLTVNFILVAAMDEIADMLIAKAMTIFFIGILLFKKYT
jgi:hypothetical protein